MPREAGLPPGTLTVLILRLLDAQPLHGGTEGYITGTGEIRAIVTCGVTSSLVVMQPDLILVKP